MRWRQFLTPVKSINTEKAKDMINSKSPGELTILDVRQPEEYETGHIPGAKLIPLGELSDSIDKLEKEKETIVYCAIGGRSRVGAQMLAGRGFDNILNLSGGFKAWKGEYAFGGSEQGLTLFAGKETVEEALVVAYSLEQGLRDFYLSMIAKVTNEPSKKLFEQLSKIEINHQERVLEEYIKITGESIDREAFEKNKVSDILEGGMTSEEYLDLFNPDPKSVTDIIEIAMSIEAQALDLYLRAADKIDDQAVKGQLLRIAEEEKAHMASLGEIIPQVI